MGWTDMFAWQRQPRSSGTRIGGILWRAYRGGKEVPLEGETLNQLMQVLNPYARISAAYQQAYEEARKANLERYQQLLDEYAKLREKVEKSLSLLGHQTEKDIRELYRQLGTQVYQDLYSRGLAGTTVLPTMQAGLTRQEAEALERAKENLLRQRLGLLVPLERERLGVIERRTDLYPDYEQLLRLMQAGGAAAGYQAFSRYPASYQAFEKAFRKVRPRQIRSVKYPRIRADRRIAANLRRIREGRNRYAAQYTQPQRGYV